MDMERIIILYMPVLHSGYISFLKKHANEGVESIYVLGEELVTEFTYFEKEIRAITPSDAVLAIKSFNLFKNVYALNQDSIEKLSENQIIMPNESTSRKFADKYLEKNNVTLDDVFLRWDEESVLSKAPPEYSIVSKEPFDKDTMSVALKESEKSSDWWRHVGAALVKNGELIYKVHNQHIPSEHTPYALGDPRDFIEPGTMSDISSALHSEQKIITNAAKDGIGLEGSSIYVTVFPCVVCAKLIAASGIKKCYFGGGHATFDGEKVLKAAEVEIILVK